MSNMCKHLVLFLKKIGKCFDKNKTDLKKIEVEFQVKLAQCGDKSDDNVVQAERVLDGKVTELAQAIHHMELNNKLT